MKIHDLKPNEGAKQEKKRVGRGHAAGQGKTAGKGTKGQHARQGFGGHIYRQGGNLPFYRRLPFMRGEGFTPPNRVEYNEVNLEMLERLDDSQEITPEVLAEANLLSKKNNPIVILGRGEVEKAYKLKVHRITKGAREKIEAAGGSVELIG
ncbi:MAG: 50S ribosomal protein L15 [Chloroflexi bacterium]|jgi:large subunit ribosomal protein L15|nr:50S ribosomal protein L15 [Chloroflexota bacterium]